jgi:hypothetical protein
MIGMADHDEEVVGTGTRGRRGPWWWGDDDDDDNDQVATGMQMGIAGMSLPTTTASPCFQGGCAMFGQQGGSRRVGVCQSSSCLHFHYLIVSSYAPLFRINIYYDSFDGLIVLL